MRKQKHYTSRDEIIRAIDAERDKQAVDRAEALRLDQLAESTFKRLAKLDYNQLSDVARLKFADDQVTAKHLRRQADDIRKRQPGIERRCLALKRTLAAFDTKPMPFSGDAVVLQ